MLKSARSFVTTGIYVTGDVTIKFLSARIRHNKCGQTPSTRTYSFRATRDWAMAQEQLAKPRHCTNNRVARKNVDLRILWCLRFLASSPFG
jgi:hypothetical protein